MPRPNPFPDVCGYYFFTHKKTRTVISAKSIDKKKNTIKTRHDLMLHKKLSEKSELPNNV